jgi:hypothetical protein
MAGGPSGDPGPGLKSWGTPLVIPAADFKTNGSNREAFFHTNSGFIYGEGTTVFLIAPVYLPTGATVVKLAAQVYDNSTGCAYPEVTVWLNRVGAANGTGMETMASMSTTSAQPDIQTISQATVSYPVIDTTRFTYYVGVMMCSASHELHSVVIYYEE